MSEKEVNPNIRDVQYGESGVRTSSVMGHPTLPQVKYPGYPVDYPTCSAPNADGNMGCDAFKKCTTPGEGPYVVAFKNKSGRKEFCHCRHWMYKLKNKPYNRALDPAEDPELIWDTRVEDEAVDPNDKDLKKGVKTKRYQIRTDNVRYPRPYREAPQTPAPEIRGVEYSEAESPEAPKGPVEGIKHGNRRKGNQVEASGE